MKNQFVATLEEGDVVNDYYVAVRKDLRDTQSGGKFLGMVFKDKSGEIGGVMWNNAVSIAQLFELGDVVNVRATVNTYQNRLQLRVDQVLPLKQDEYDPADLVFTPEDRADAMAKFRAILDTVENKWLKAVIDAFLSDVPFMEKLAGAGAGKRWHHAYPGGLIQHCYEMAEIAETMCRLFPTLDRDLLMTGVFVHDIGKVEELSQGIYVDYTTPGKLVGHLQLGCNMVNRKIDTMEGFPEQLRMELLHLILSHHGEQEMGSPVVPKSLEAIVLAHIDNLDAQTDAFKRVIEDATTKGQEWSDYQNLISRQIWTKKE